MESVPYVSYFKLWHKVCAARRDVGTVELRSDCDLECALLLKAGNGSISGLQQSAEANMSDALVGVCSKLQQPAEANTCQRL